MSNDIRPPKNGRRVRFSRWAAWVAIRCNRAAPQATMIDHSRWTQLELHWLQGYPRVNFDGRFAGTQFLEVLFPGVIRIFPWVHFLHDSVPYVLSLSPQLLSNHLPARINFLLNPLIVVLSLHPGFFNHFQAPFINLSLHILLRLHFPMTS